MALILNIDTAVDVASICLAKDEAVLSIAINESQKDHASWLHIAIKEIFEKNNLELRSVDAIAITSGPGSYTGLRIGMATAKGICYALNKPLIGLNTRPARNSQAASRFWIAMSMATISAFKHPRRVSLWSVRISIPVGKPP